jgi:hypothetical protein
MLCKKNILITFFIFSFSVNAEVGRLYYSNFLGHVHKNPSKDSTSLTIIQCSHSVALLKSKVATEGWRYVRVGSERGYVQSRFLSSKRPSCLQEKYPKYYNSLNLTISEMYYWGRLYDQYLQGKSKIR